MKIYGKIEGALVMTKKQEQGKKDPSKKYCRVGVVMGDELGEISATEEVYNAVERGKLYSFGTVYNSDWDMFQLEKAIPLNPEQETPASAPAETRTEFKAETEQEKAAVEEKTESKAKK